MCNHTETGTYYLRARYYDPRIGRFTSEDNARDGINWYAYCYNDPLTFIDPSGNVGIMPDGTIYRSENDTDLDVRILKYKIAIENATCESSKKYLENKLTSLISTIENKNKRKEAEKPLEHFKINDITEKLNNFMSDEKATFSDVSTAAGYVSIVAINAKLIVFYELVRNHGPLDLKNTTEWDYTHFIYYNEIIDNDAPGNINYGYLGKVFGFSDLLLYSAAGAAQIAARTSRLKFIKSFFDDPRDQKMIKYGIERYKKGY